MTYSEALAFLYEKLPMYQEVGQEAYKKDLDRTRSLLKFLGNPECDFKSVHIAGTNGKGSTAHILASIYQEGGYKVGLHTSPHLKSYTERIRVNSKEVSKDWVCDFVRHIMDEVDKIRPSFFELSVAMAFTYFSESKVDLAVIETGMGGRLDSTNVITPVLSVITSIGLDHQNFLGDTLPAIAREKAGIIKKGVPVVVGDINNESLEELLCVARNQSSVLVKSVDRYELSHNKSMGLDVMKSEEIYIEGLRSELIGESIEKNLPAVLSATDMLQGILPIAKADMVSGIEFVCTNTGLRGRWQILRERPLTICDVGHNEQAIKGLVKRISALDTRTVRIIWGMTTDKVNAKVLSFLSKDWTYYFCAARLPRAMPASELASLASDFELIGQVFDSVDQAYQKALKDAQDEDILFIGGSTFVVAELNDL